MASRTEAAGPEAEDDGPGMDPRIAERRSQVHREQVWHRVRLLIVGLAAAALVGLAAGALYSPLLALRHVRIAAPAAVSRAEVLSAAGLTHSRPLIEIDTGAVAAHLNDVPRLGAARVHRSWPGTVSISVALRTAVAVVPRSNPPGAAPPDGGAPWATVDATGRVLAYVQGAAGLPLVQGVGPVPAPGDWLNAAPGPAVVPPSPNGSPPVDLDAAANSPSVPSATGAGLAIVPALPATLRPDVLTVSVQPGNQLGLSVVAVGNPTAGIGPISVNLGDPSQLAAKLTSLAAMLTQANLAGIAGIDLTIPDRPAALTAR
jgi:hypothetical protein